MSECKQKYIEWSSENGNYCGEYDNGRLIGTDAVNEFDGWEAAWSHQQAIIDDLIYKAKLRESDHQALLVKYQATKKCWEDMGKECESLKSQLNNIEACYIEKKKQVEAVSQVLCELKESMDGFKEMDLYDKGYRVAVEYVIADLEKALRGENDQSN